MLDLTIDPVDFEVTDYDIEWIKDFSADIGGYDGTYPVVTITKATVSDFDGDEYEVDREYLVASFGAKIVEDAEITIQERIE